MLDKIPFPEIHNTIFYTLHGKYVTYGYAKAESFQLSTKIWSMTCDQEALLKKEKKCKASIYWTHNPQINWEERGSTDVKYTEFLFMI